MRNGYALRRAALGLLAATLGGAAASAGAIHLRSQLTTTAQATTFSCGPQATAGQGSIRLQKALSAQSGNQTVCETGKSHTMRPSASTAGNQLPVVAVPVTVHAESNAYAGKVINRRSRQDGIFVGEGSVSYGSVTYCNRNCFPGREKSGGTTMPVTVVDVRYTSNKRKTSTNK